MPQPDAPSAHRWARAWRFMRGPDVATTSLRWVFATFIACLVLLLGAHAFFAKVQEDLSARSANEQARLFIGEEIVRGISRLEADIYKLSIASGLASFQRVQRSIEAELEKLHHDLQVLEQGGVVRREVRLNIDGHDEMMSEVTYRVEPGRQSYVMESIEVKPLLDEVLPKIREMERLQVGLWEAQEQESRQNFFEQHARIDVYFKTLPSYFERLNENANRLFYDSSEKLRVLKADLQVQSQRMKTVEVLWVVLVVVLGVFAGWAFLRRIGQANRDLAATLEAMRQARDAAEKASQAKSEFVSRMSHELRTPLNAIIGFAELLGDEPLGPSPRNYVRLINGSGKHLLDLINDVLDHAKIEAGSLTLESIPFDLAATIEAVKTIVGERATAKGLAFTASVPEGLPRYVIGDPMRLRQVLINLLSNAVKFTERGSVQLSVSQLQGYWRFSVRDSGIGMDEATLSRLFKPFSQADNSITRKFGGTGLGLLISKDLIEAMGGHIEVDSALGVGTVFWFSLPLPVTEAPAEFEATSYASQIEEVARLVPGRVLLVDDNRVNQQLGAAMLQKLGLEYDLADNGEMALQRLAQHPYALVLMDMEMPVLDGVSTTQQYRAQEALQGRSRLPIVAMTANALQEDRERCFAAGMDGYVAKPISLGALRDELRRLFGDTVQPSRVPPDEAAVAEVPVFDRAAALALLGDDGALLQELAGMFVADVPNNLAALEAAFAQGDADTLGRAAHSLKGLFATFVAPAAELEQAARRGDLSAGADMIAEIKARTDELVHALLAQAPGPNDLAGV